MTQHEPDDAQAADAVETSDVVLGFSQAEQRAPVRVERISDQQPIPSNVQLSKNNIVSCARYRQHCKNANKDAGLNDKINASANLRGAHNIPMSSSLIGGRAVVWQNFS